MHLSSLNVNSKSNKTSAVITTAEVVFLLRTGSHLPLPVFPSTHTPPVFACPLTFIGTLNELVEDCVVTTANYIRASETTIRFQDQKKGVFI